MRTVPRRHTRQWPDPPAPWSVRETVPEGAPRVLRSNVIWPVRVDNHEVGVIDRRFHFYSHWGYPAGSPLAKVDGSWHIRYRFGIEWGIVLDHAFWIEFVSDSRQAVARISRRDAVQYGFKTTHGDHAVWAVPFNHYEVHKR